MAKPYLPKIRRSASELSSEKDNHQSVLASIRTNVCPVLQNFIDKPIRACLIRVEQPLLNTLSIKDEKGVTFRSMFSQMMLKMPIKILRKRSIGAC